MREMAVQQTPVIVKADIEGVDMPFRTRTATLDLNDRVFTASSTADYNRIYVNIYNNDHCYTYSESGLSLTADEISYFPLGVSTVDVYGHYPYSEGFSSVDDQDYFTIREDQSSDDAYLMSDLMTADNSPAIRTKQSDGTWLITQDAMMNFKHQMAKLIIKVATDERPEGGSGLTIKKVVVNGVKPRVPITYSQTTGKYEVGPATTDATGHSYDMEILNGTGTACVLIPPQRYNVEGDDDPDDPTDFRRFITITYDWVNPLVSEDTRTDAEMVYFFKGNGKLFKAGCVYDITLVPGKRDVGIHDEYGVDGVELAKFAAKEDATCVYVFAAEEKLSIVNELMDPEVNAAEKTYTGSEITLDTSEDELVVKLKDGTPLVEGDDFELHYSNNVNVGTAVVTIMGIGRYAGTIETGFTIVPKSIQNNDITVSFPHVPTYDGSRFEPTPTITDAGAGKELTRYDYETSAWTNNINAGSGTASVTIKGIGNYKDTRVESFSINKTQGGVTFDDAFNTSGTIPTLTLIKPEGHPFDYVDTFKSILGDGVLEGVTSSNPAVLDITEVANGKWTFHVYQSGNATLTFTINGDDYDYSSPKPTCNIVITDGPALPIEYVGLYNLETYSPSYKLAEDNYSEHSCWLRNDGPHLRHLCQYGLTIGGQHYHLPSTYEWRSIIPASSVIYWGKSFFDMVESGIAFGVTTTQTDDYSDTDYTHAITTEQTETWISDFYSAQNYNVSTDYHGVGGSTMLDRTRAENIERSPNCTIYALRFKGTTYCSAWRYDWIWTTDGTEGVSGVGDTRALTENELGRKTMVVRVIYMGPSFKYANDYRDLTNPQYFDWDNIYGQTTVYKRCFPCTGTGADGVDANNIYVDAPARYTPSYDRPDMNWFWSASHTPTSSRWSVRISDTYTQGDQNHANESFSIRFFKDK